MIRFRQTEQLFADGYLSPAEKTNALKQAKQRFPEGVTRCGADALRLSLLQHDVLSDSVTFDIQQSITARNLCNKIWQGT